MIIKETRMKVRIKGRTGAKLQFVKIMKDYANCGLKEAKDLVDSLEYSVPALPAYGNARSFGDYIELNIDSSLINKLHDDLAEIGIETTSKEQMRLSKLDKIMEESKDMYELQLNEKIHLTNMTIIRVPGGWIYEFDNSTAFIAYNEEFKK